LLTIIYFNKNLEVENKINIEEKRVQDAIAFLNENWNLFKGKTYDPEHYKQITRMFLISVITFNLHTEANFKTLLELAMVAILPEEEL
jgi:hypothetical protein